MVKSSISVVAIYNMHLGLIRWKIIKRIKKPDISSVACQKTDMAEKGPGRARFDPPNSTLHNFFSTSHP